MGAKRLDPRTCCSADVLRFGAATAGCTASLSLFSVIQVFRTLLGGQHPIALREFCYSLSDDEQQQLTALVAKLARWTMAAR